MLLRMKALVEAGRGLACLAGAALDRAQGAADAAERQLAQARVDLLTPIVKAWCTDRGVEVASLGVQVHGGMGFIEETGAAQHYRDARIGPIYEGTNGIQANDLLFRKTVRDEGVAAQAFIVEMRFLAVEAAQSEDESLQAVGKALEAALAALDPVVDWMVVEGAERPAQAASGAASYLELFGLVAGAYVLARLALGGGDAGRQGLRAGTRRDRPVPCANPVAARRRPGGSGRGGPPGDRRDAGRELLAKGPCITPSPDGAPDGAPDAAPDGLREPHNLLIHIGAHDLLLSFPKQSSRGEGRGSIVPILHSPE